MATIKLSLPDPMTDWVTSKAQSSRFGSPGEYICDLIRKDQQRSAAMEELQALVTEGLESGESDEPFAETIAKARNLVLERLKA